MSETNSSLAETEVEDGKNRRKIKCQYCRSIILNSKAGNYVNFEVIQIKIFLRIIS